MIHEDCFAYMTAKGRAHCVALKELYCKKEDCKWYKPKEQREVKQAVGDAKQHPVLETYRNEVDTEYIDCLFRNEAKGYYELYKAVGIGPVSYTHLDVYKRQGFAAYSVSYTAQTAGTYKIYDASTANNRTLVYGVTVK